MVNSLCHPNTAKKGLANFLQSPSTRQALCWFLFAVTEYLTHPGGERIWFWEPIVKGEAERMSQLLGCLLLPFYFIWFPACKT